MRCLATVAVFAACTISDPIPTGVVEVQLNNREGVPLAAWPVVFHAADGSRLATVETTPHGLAVGPMEPGGLVTYRSPRPENQLITRGGLAPGDRVEDGEVPQHVEPDELSITVATPGAPATAGLCHVEVACGDRLITKRGVPGAELTVDLPASCLKPGSAHLYTLVRATDERYETIAYAELAVAPSERVSVTTWRSDFVDATATITGLDHDLVRYSIEAESFVGDAAVAHIYHGGHGPASELSAALRFPAGIPGASHYRFDATFWTGQLVVEQRVAPGTPFVLGPDDLPPKIIAMHYDVEARKVSFATARPIEDSARVEAVLIDIDSSWRLVMTGPTIELPDIDVTAFPFLPYFSTSSLELHEVSASYTRGDTTLVTAFPYTRL
jgi:hypothetical protein